MTSSTFSPRSSPCSEYVALAYYCLAPIADPERLAEEHRELLARLDGRGRIYLSEQGINAQASLSKDALPSYLAFARRRHPLSEHAVHTQDCTEHLFPKLAVKVRAQLVALDRPVQLNARAEELSPMQWEEMLRTQADQVAVVDVRNQIEWELGHFEGALAPHRAQFREFCDFDRDLAPAWGRQTPILMYCTGGIRCQCCPAHLRARGYHNLYQLRGGILGYAASMGARHWLGKLFVFDKRLTVDLGANARCGKCLHCPSFPDSIFNCANVDCNALFLSCTQCWRSTLGYCRKECRSALRRRAIDAGHPGRLFGRMGVATREERIEDNKMALLRGVDE